MMTRFCCLLAFSLTAAQSPAGDDRSALSGIFDEQHVAGTAFDMHGRATAMSAAQRYEWLSRWLLPGVDHPHLRVEAAFSPTDPGPIAVDPLNPGMTVQNGSLAVGGVVVSPLLDLIATAREIGKLDELRKRITGPANETQAQDDSRDAVLDPRVMLALIELEAGNLAQATLLVEQIHELVTHPTTAPVAADRAVTPSGTTQVTANKVELFEPSDAVLILLSRIVDVPELRELAGMLLARSEQWMRDKYEPGAKQRHLMALSNSLRLLDESRAAGVEMSNARQSTQWRSVSRATSISRGSGSPTSQWMYRPGQAELVVPHERDYLYFNVPLSGNYDLECDVAVSGWNFLSPNVAGRWVGPVYTQAGFDSGCFRWQAPRESFTPPLTRTRHWIHYRASVRDGLVTTFFNGRPINTRSVRGKFDPWISMRSNPRDRGTVRDIRISGTPTIPEEIVLSEDVGLGQWCTYFGEEVGDEGDHWLMKNGVLHGQQDGTSLLLDGPHGQGSDDSSSSVGWDERLLRYHRPMLEDGVITYEFLYQPGSAHAHPALDRLAFLLSPSGVRLHQITDGPNDRSGLSSTNTFDEPQHRRGPAQLPLKQGDWNRVELRVTGDVVAIVLNDKEVFHRPLEGGNQRTFGLFHFADQTAVQVRNIRWRGSWPRELPTVSQQELASHATDFLEEKSERLAATFQHDFVQEGLPLDRFTLVRGDLGTHVKATPDGVLTTREGTGGYLNATIAPALRITGDFDVIAEFDRFDGECAADGSCTVALMAFLENATNDEHWVGRRHSPKPNNVIEQIVQCVVVRKLPKGEQRQYFVTEPMEERSGRFALARRGDRLYYLTAEADSSNWRLRGERTIATDPVATDGLRLFAQIHQKGGAVSVNWKRLQIRAEGLSGQAMGSRNVELAELNEQRDKLPAEWRHDFRSQAPTANRFYQWGLPQEWKASETGWLIPSKGSDEWMSCGAAPYVQLVGDFDISISFDPKQLAKPKAGEYTQIYLQLEGSDPSRTQVNSILNLMPTGEFVATAQVREKKSNGTWNYRPIGSAGMTTVQRLRLCRRGSSVFFLAASKDDTDDQVLSRYPFNDLPIAPRNLRFMIHTGGEGLESKVTWQTMEIRATEIQDVTPPMPEPMEKLRTNPVPPGSNPAPPPAKSLLERALDYFRK